MVEPSRHIDLPSLTLDELTGVVNLYPWFSAARMELCRRMFAMGENAWSPEEFGAQALYMADRSKFSDLVRGRRQIDCSDRDVEELLASFLEPFFYHPINVFFSLRGYVKQILGTQMVWGNMTRKGVQSANKQPAPGVAGSTDAATAAASVASVKSAVAEAETEKKADA